MRRVPICILGAALLSVAATGPRAAQADSFDGIYTARAMVTGTRAETRPAGFADCLDDVLVKVSGDPRLIGDPRVKRLEPTAGKLVTGFRYHDQLEGIPIHDEQGTRDRAFDLICDFDRAGVDRILHALGEAPWRGHRPRLAMFIGVTTLRGPFVLAADGDRGMDMLGSLATAANKRGLPEVLPDVAQLTRNRIDFHQVETARPSGFAAAARDVGAEMPLVGTLTWSDRPAGWVTRWRFEWRGHLYRWGGKGISFDEAFRRGFQGVLQILSGHGAP